MNKLKSPFFNYANLFIMCFSIVFGCTSYTPMKSSWRGGYADQKILDDVFVVKVSSNAYTTEERHNDFRLLRSAEVTLENGYKYFSILDWRTAVVLIKTIYKPSQRQEFNAEKLNTDTVVFCFKEKPESTDENTIMYGIIYDAAEVSGRIKTKYGIE